MSLLAKKSSRRLALIIMLALSPYALAADLGKGVYMTTEQFLNHTFADAPPTPKVIWLNADIKEQLAKILHRPYRSLRVRYWQQGTQSAWVFNEIGKEMPITIGVVLNGQQVESVKILTFRESRGWEVKYPFFTDQFQGIALTKKNKLNQYIDGITGATLSVAAVKRATKLALYLNQIAINQ